MNRKNLRFVLLGVSMTLTNFTFAQLFINSAQFFVQSGATVTVQGDVTSNVDILGPGQVILQGSTNQNINMGGARIPNLVMNNAANATLLSNAQIGSNLLFTSGSIKLGNYNLIIDSAATITTPSANGFVVTNGGGRLVKAYLGSTPFTYPVGDTTSTYNPVTISNSGTVDSISVRSLGGVLSGGLTGTAFTKEVINTSWDIEEAVAGGSNLSVTANWAKSQQLAGYNAAKPKGISNYITAPAANVGWDLLNSTAATETATAGTPDSSITRTGITNMGAFAVGQRPVLSPLLVAPKVFLQGPYNTATNTMNINLATLGLIPTTEPYTGITGFTHSGSGGGETVSSSTIFVTDSIVDWVFVQIHNSATGTVVSTRSALLKSNGTIVETDGVTPLSMAGNAPGSYYISVRHRNHLGVRTASTQDLSSAKVTTFGYNFASGLGQALAPAANTAMTNKYGTATTTPNYMLWAGNSNAKLKVTYSGGGNSENALLNGAPLSGNKSSSGSAVGYYLSDLNMNGKVSYSGGGNDENILLNISLLGNKTATGISQANF